MSDINTAVVDSLKVLDPNRPIREADKRGNRPAPAMTRMTQERVRQAKLAKNRR